MGNLENHITIVDWSPCIIRIPKNTLVLLCGVQNAGKSTFAKMHFPHLNIISSDALLQKTIMNASSNNTTEEILDKTIALMQKEIKKSSKKNAFTVVDSVGISFTSRILFISKYERYFENIILIVFNPDLETILNRPNKPSTKEMIEHGFFSLSKEELTQNFNILQEQLKNGEISESAPIIHILDENSNCTIEFDF